MKFNFNHFLLLVATPFVINLVSGLITHPKNLTCYTCSSNTHSDCQTLNSSSHYEKQCKQGEDFCMVTRVKYSLESEDKSRKFWSIERNCAKDCDSGCITLGERTKLFFCRQCCRGSLCNNGTGTAANAVQPGQWTIALLSIFYLCRYLIQQYS